MTGSQTYRPAYRIPPMSWQPPPRPRCECNQLRCRLARAEAERDALRAAVDAARRELEVAGA